MDTQKKKKIAELGKNKNGEPIVRIKFSYDLDTLFQVRSIPDRKYHKEDESWSAPVSVKVIQLLIEFGFTIDDKLTSFLTDAQSRESKISENGIPGLKIGLFPYQAKGVAFIENNNGRALINDETGLGKTIMVLGWLQLHPEKRPVVIVVPNSDKLFWKKEAEKFMSNPKIEVLSDISYSWQPNGEIFITSYYEIFNWVNKLKSINPQVIVIDEIHNISDKSKNHTKAIQKLGKNVSHVICLTGISVPARPLEAFYAIKLIKPDLFPSFADFTRRYGDAVKPTYYTWEDYGITANNTNSNRREEKLADFIKWLKEQVDKGLIEIGEFDQVGKAVESEWTNKYIVDSYKRKELQSRYGAEKGVFNPPFHIDRVGLIFSQVFSDLKGITEPMDAVMSRILAQGMVDGEGPVKLARKIEAAINGTGLGDLGITNEFISETIISARRRSEMIAHTEMMRAYHKSSMQEFKNWRELGIDAKAEWKTAGDNRVCDFCKALEGKIFTVEEIENMIPLHPECRCIALTYIEELLKYETKPKEEVDWLGQREGISTKGTHLNELYDYLTGTIMIRRLKTDVHLELPKIMFSFVPMEMDNRIMYEAEELRFISFLKRESKNDSNGHPEEIEDSYLERLIQVISKAKLKQSIEWIKNYLEIGNKFVLFSTCQYVLDALADFFKGSSIKIDMTSSSLNHKNSLEEFENDKKLRLLIYKLETFNEEIKLPRINYVFHEVPLSLYHMTKIEGILNLIEEESKTNIYYLYGVGTIEDKIAKYIEKDYQINKRLWIDFQSIITRVKNEYCE